MVHGAGAYVHDKLLLPINCNPFVMSWSGAHLCIPRLTCRISRSDGAKESCDCSLWMSLCGCILQQLFPMSLELQQEKSQAPLVLIFHYLAQWAKALCKEAMVSPSDFIKDTTVTNIVFFGFHSLMTQFCKFFLLEVFVYICLPQSVTNVMKFAAALSHCAAHRIDVCPYKVA